MGGLYSHLFFSPVRPSLLLKSQAITELAAKKTTSVNSGWRTWTASLVTAATLFLFGGLEVLLVFLIRGPYSRGVEWPVTLVGVLAAILLVSGYVPVPFEILKRRGRVIGIDFGFLTIDCLGAFFSLMAIGMLRLTGLH